MLKRGLVLILAYVIFGQVVVFADIPGGNIRDGEGLVPRTFEIMLSPQVVVSTGDTYLTSELRYQPNEDVGMGFAFGSGELGFNFGGYGMWYILPDTSSQPALGVLGGFYMNRLNSEDYFVMRISPVVSKHFSVRWGGLTPYWGLQFTPSFGFGKAPNILSMRTSMGIQTVIHSLRGLRIWTEFGLGLTNSVNEVALAISFPFSSLAE